MPRVILQTSRFLGRTNSSPVLVQDWLRKSHFFRGRNPEVQQFKSLAQPADKQSSIFDELNKEQLSAAKSDKQHIRLVAGPGSGKTRVVSARIAHLVTNETQPCSSHQIMAITFTKRASEELEQRLKAVLPADHNVATGTFHSIANRYVRKHVFLLKCGLKRRYSIVDADEQLKLMQYLVKNGGRFHLKEGKQSKSKLLAKILGAKDEEENDDSDDDDDDASTGSGNSSVQPNAQGQDGPLSTQATVNDGVPSNGSTPSYGEDSKQKRANLQYARQLAKQLLEEIGMMRSNVSSSFEWDPAAGKMVARTGSALFKEAVAVQESCTADKLKSSSLKSQREYFYDRYQRFKTWLNAIDFDDILFLFIALLEHVPDFQAMIHKRYRHFLVDEFQDTNMAQYHMLRSMMHPQASLFIVGDPNQSIYTWRGAQLHIMEDMFDTDFKAGETMNLTINYRSVAPLVQLSDAIICSDIKPKLHKPLLHSRQAQLDSISCRVRWFHNCQHEAQWVVEEVVEAMSQGRCYSDMAVLCRTNYMVQQTGMRSLFCFPALPPLLLTLQPDHTIPFLPHIPSLTSLTTLLLYLGQVIERMFVKKRIPYVFVNNTSFWDRVEVKDLIAYLQVAWSLENDLKLDRIINTPTRSLGAKAIEKLGNVAEDKGMTKCQLLFQNCTQVQLDDSLFLDGKVPSLKDVAPHIPTLPYTAKELDLNKKPYAALQELRCLMVLLRNVVIHHGVGPAIKTLLKCTEYETYLWKKYRKDEESDIDARLRNIQLLVDLAREHDRAPALELVPADDGDIAAELRTDEVNDDDDVLESKLEVLMDFLDSLVLKSGVGEHTEAAADAVKIMTVHSSKGLEFPVVIVPGVEESMYKWNEAEAKRLLYVAITRAKDYVAVGWAKWRQVFGSGSSHDKEGTVSQYMSTAVSKVYPQKGFDLFKSGMHIREPVTRRLGSRHRLFPK